MSGNKAGFRQRTVAFLTRKYPFFSGCDQIAVSRLVRLAAGRFDGPVYARLNSGVEALVTVDEFVGKMAFFLGDLDRRVSLIASRIVRSGDTVLDIGANLGLVSLPLAKLVGNKGTVHAFEPNPRVRGLLLQSVTHNNLENVQVHSCALGASECEMTLNVPWFNAGMGSLSRIVSGNGNSQVSVQVRTLNDVAAEFGVTSVRFVKIDVEGFELEVLLGAVGWIDQHPPQSVLYEANGTPQQNLGVYEFLKSRGYEMYQLTKKLREVRLVKFCESADQDLFTQDILAIRKDSVEEILELCHS